MNLPQRRLQSPDPFAVELTEPGEAEPVLSAHSLAVFLPEQRQCHVRPPQFAVHDGPVGNRSLLRHRRRGWRIQQRLQLRVIEVRQATANFRTRGGINESRRPEQSKDGIRNLLGATRDAVATLAG